MSYKKLVDGFYRFQEEYIHSEKGADYKKLVEQGQQPEALIIACSDSRIDPAILTYSDPGEFFAIRNVAALVPPYKHNGLLSGTTAAIEFAVRHLEVKHVVVLGHEGCGGVNALATDNYQVTENHDFQFMSYWLDIGAQAKEEVFEKICDAHEEHRIRALEQASILVSLENLLSFPWVKDRCDREELQLHGWYFDMSKGEMLEYNEENTRFECVNQLSSLSMFPKEAPDRAQFLDHYLKNCSCSSKD